MSQRVSTNKASGPISRREDFTTSGALRGQRVPGFPDSGRLNEEWRTLLREDMLGPGLAYAVFSYGTPIAWETKDGKVRRVDQRFSVTTSKHQTQAGALN